RTEDLPAPRWRRSEQWPLPEAPSGQSRRYNPEAVCSHEGSRKRRGVPRRLLRGERRQEVCGERRLRQPPSGLSAVRRAGLLQRGTASSDFLRASSMRRRRRFLMLSSTWLQKRRKYCAAEMSALMTTSQSKTCPSSLSQG